MSNEEKNILTTLIRRLTIKIEANQFYEGKPIIDEQGIKILIMTIKGM